MSYEKPSVERVRVVGSLRVCDSGPKLDQVCEV
jgi:hypothetical protein